jgi:hypothetical protein
MSAFKIVAPKDSSIFENHRRVGSKTPLSFGEGQGVRSK